MNHSVKKTIQKHQEHNISAQSIFADEVSTLFKTIEDMGNTFMEEIDGLLVLDSLDIAYQAII